MSHKTFPVAPLSSVGTAQIGKFNTLVGTLFETCLKFLDVQTLCRSSPVCKGWNARSKASYIWQVVMQPFPFFNTHVHPLHKMDCKVDCVQIYRIQKTKIEDLKALYECTFTAANPLSRWTDASAEECSTLPTNLDAYISAVQSLPPHPKEKSKVAHSSSCTMHDPLEFTHLVKKMVFFLKRAKHYRRLLAEIFFELAEAINKKVCLRSLENVTCRQLEKLTIGLPPLEQRVDVLFAGCRAKQLTALSTEETVLLALNRNGEDEDIRSFLSKEVLHYNDNHLLYGHSPNEFFRALLNPNNTLNANGLRFLRSCVNDKIVLIVMDYLEESDDVFSSPEELRTMLDAHLALKLF